MFYSKSKAIKFEVDISRIERSVRFHLGAVPNASTGGNSFPFQCKYFFKSCPWCFCEFTSSKPLPRFVHFWWSEKILKNQNATFSFKNDEKRLKILFKNCMFFLWMKFIFLNCQMFWSSNALHFDGFLQKARDCSELIRSSAGVSALPQTLLLFLPLNPSAGATHSPSRTLGFLVSLPVSLSFKVSMKSLHKCIQKHMRRVVSSRSAAWKMTRRE